MSDKEKGVGIDRELTGEIRLGKPISSKKYWELVFDTKQEAQRAVDCLQAMSGIADPQKFIEAVGELEQWVPGCLRGMRKQCLDEGYSKEYNGLFQAFEKLQAAHEGVKA